MFLLYDYLDPYDDKTMKELFTEPAVKLACFKIDLFFHSYFNMPLLQSVSYCYSSSI